MKSRATENVLPCVIMLIFFIIGWPSSCLNLQELYSRLHNNSISEAEKHEIGNSLLVHANHLFSQNSAEEALTIFTQLHYAFPTSSVICHNIGYVLAELNRPSDALPFYKQALFYNPHNAETHLCFATALLATGNYHEGMAEYEWRWHQHNPLAAIPIALWRGESVAKKSILLHSEGALGDVLQYIRFAQILKKQGALVYVRTHSCLLPLLSLCSYIDKLISNNDPLPSADLQQSLMSVPFYLHMDYNSLPATPYLTAHKELVTFWQRTIQQDSQFKVGICWQADPHHDAQRPHLAQRSITLKELAPLFAIPDITWYSLQAVDGTEQLASAREFVHCFDNDFDKTAGSFMDTAAVITHLDLVITVDTSVAHLAGALGKPTWLLLPYKADWRWHYSADTTPWYPSMVFFRKTDSVSWNSVVEKIQQKLITVTNTRSKKRVSHEMAV